MVALAIVGSALAITAASTQAASSRDEYAAQVNSICASASAQVQELSRSIESRLKRINRKLKSADGQRRQRLLARSRKLSSALAERRLRIQYAEVAQLRSVPASPGDEALVSSWLDSRKTILDLTAQVDQIDRRVDRLFGRFETRDIREFDRLHRKIRRLDRRANQLNNRIISLESRHDELGTELGATSCVIDVQ